MTGFSSTVDRIRDTGEGCSREGWRKVAEARSRRMPHKTSSEAESELHVEQRTIAICFEAIVAGQRWHLLNS